GDAVPHGGRGGVCADAAPVLIEKRQGKCGVGIAALAQRREQAERLGIVADARVVEAVLQWPGPGAADGQEKDREHRPREATAYHANHPTQAARACAIPRRQGPNLPIYNRAAWP